MTRLLCLCALGISYLRVEAVRMGDDAVLQPAPAKNGKSTNEFKKDVPSLLKFWIKRFSNEENFPQDRDNLAKIRQLDMSGGGDGSGKEDDNSASKGDSGADKKFQYLGTQCMQERVRWAASVMTDYRCKRILEVGGFRTPLPEAIKKKKLPKELELYVDVDPSAEETKEEDFGNGIPSATFQLLLDEFRGPEAGGLSPHYGKDFDCFLGLGTSLQNIGDEQSKQAYQDALVSSNIAIIEYPFSNKQSMNEQFIPLLDRSGFSEEAEFIVNCSTDKDSKKKRDKEVPCGGDDNIDCLVRRAVLFKRNFVATPQEVEKMAS